MMSTQNVVNSSLCGTFKFNILVYSRGKTTVVYLIYKTVDVGFSRVIVVTNYPTFTEEYKCHPSNYR